MDCFRKVLSPPLLFPDAVVSLAAVALLETRELCLIVAHPDGCVSAWSARDPSASRMPRRQLHATCVSSAPGSAQHSALVWIGHGHGVSCHSAHTAERGEVRLYHHCDLAACLCAPLVAVECGGDLIVAMERRAAQHVLCWRHALPTEHRMTDGAAAAALAARVDFAGAAAVGPAASLLLVGRTAWVGCGGGAIALVACGRSTAAPSPLRRLRTAGTCAVTALALLGEAEAVASGLANGDIVLWSAGAAVALALVGRGAGHSGAVCAMAYLPWSRHLCSVGAAREVLLWDWRLPQGTGTDAMTSGSGTAEARMVIASRGVINESVQAVPQRLCVVNEARLIACAAETGHVLRWSPCVEAKEATRGDYTHRSASASTSASLRLSMNMHVSEVKELHEECRRWEQLCNACEADRCALERSAEAALSRQVADTQAAVARAEELIATNAALTKQIEELKRRGTPSAQGPLVLLDALNEARSEEGEATETSSSLSMARPDNTTSKNTWMDVDARGTRTPSAAAEGTVPAYVAEALRGQLALFDALLRSHRVSAAASPDPLLVQSTNILTDVFLMTRDALGVDDAASLAREALGANPLALRERDVVCKLFGALCYRYRAALAGLAPKTT